MLRRGYEMAEAHLDYNTKANVAVIGSMGKVANIEGAGVENLAEYFAEKEGPLGELWSEILKKKQGTKPITADDIATIGKKAIDAYVSQIVGLEALKETFKEQGAQLKKASLFDDNTIYDSYKTLINNQMTSLTDMFTKDFTEFQNAARKAVKEQKPLTVEG